MIITKGSSLGSLYAFLFLTHTLFFFEEYTFYFQEYTFMRSVMHMFIFKNTHCMFQEYTFYFSGIKFPFMQNQDYHFAK